MSLKYKLTMIFAIALLLVMAITYAASQRVARITVESELREQLDKLANNLHAGINREVRRRGYLNKQNAYAVVSSILAGYPGPVGVSLYYGVSGIRDGFTQPMFRYGLSDVKPDRREPLSDDGEEEETIRKSYHFFLAYGMSADLGLEITMTDADRLANRLARLFLLITASLLSVLLIVIYYIARQEVSQPLGELWHLTQKVARGNLEVVPTSKLSARSDEIGVLTASFETMLSALRKARDENQRLLERTQGFNRELEKVVADATQALAEKTEALIDAREELSRRERLAALGQLAGSIAHEIGTPLSTLSGYLQLLLSDSSLGSEVREPLEVAAGEAERMTRIIRRFLDSTRGLSPAPSEIDLAELVDDVVDLTIPKAARARHEVRIELAEDACHVVTDPGLLRQVLTNLVKNAIDAMEEEGALTVRSYRENAFLLLEVEDEGPGIPIEVRPRIFKPFFTTKEAGRGTGLGLAICQEIMKALQGSLELEDAREGSGACFVIHLHSDPP